MLDKFRRTKSYHILSNIAKSATFALALSVLFFGYEVYKEYSQERRNNEHVAETVRQLDAVRQSLSTRFLGTFPNYLTDINCVLENLQAQDTVIIFEDVLYYGIRSRPDDFIHFLQLLVHHSVNGGTVIVAYYDNHPDFLHQPVWNSVFHRMILEARVAPNFIPQIAEERAEQSNLLNKSYSTINKIDSMITEKYFVQTREDDYSVAENTWKGYLANIVKEHESDSLKTTLDVAVYQLCLCIDSIKQLHLGNNKTLDEVCFADYESMYSDITDCIALCFQNNGIELLPLNEYLTMSCWLVKPASKSRAIEAILAFPSKYASEEIGFYSQDKSFANYITVMLKGIKSQSGKKKREK